MAATNLRESDNGTGLDWLFNLDGVADMYYSYAETDLWPTLDNLPEGALLNFVNNAAPNGPISGTAQSPQQGRGIN